MNSMKRDAIESTNNLTNPSISNLAANPTSVTCLKKEFQTPNSIRKSRNGTFHSFPIVNTPTPPSRFRKIINPFEAGIADRLHLPLIDRLVFVITMQMCLFLLLLLNVQLS